MRQVPAPRGDATAGAVGYGLVMTHSGCWTTRSSTPKYTNPWISVREDAVVRPDGGEGVYGVVTMRNPAVFVVAMTDEDEVLMVSLYRYPTQAMSLEVPAGGSDGENLLLAAQRELVEETGYTAREWREIGRMNALNGVCDAPEHVFLATGLQAPASVEDAERAAREQKAEGISAVRAVPWRDLTRLVADREITDGETLAALMFAAATLGRL